MRRFFVPDDFQETEVWAHGDEARHMVTVMRLKPGDSVALFNGKGSECVGEIVESVQNRKSAGKSVKIRISDVAAVNREIGLDIFVAVSAPKGKRAEVIIQKCSELGVKSVIPLNTERCVAKADSGSKLDKWRRIATEASKQCGRNKVTEITDVYSIEALGTLISACDLSIIFCAGSNNVEGIKNILVENPGIKSVLCMIGPEGGFAESEIEEAMQSGCRAAKLTPQILRVETAVIAAVSMIIYQYAI